MPYTKQEDRDAVAKNVDAVKDPGDLNFLITSFILDQWKKQPRYLTIHVLRREMVTEPKNSSFLNDLRRRFAGDFTVGDIYAAAANAYQEFNDRIVRRYEKLKRQQNGDIPAYLDAIRAIDDEMKAKVEQVAE